MVIACRAVLVLAVSGAAVFAQSVPAPADSQPAPPAAPAGWTRVDLATLAPPLIDEETARKMFAGVRSGKRQKWDPISLQALKENVNLAFKWEEHEGGRVTMRTNNLGFRRDSDISPLKTSLRVFVAGDSHTDGLVNNAESFVTLLENRLNAQGDDKRYECINAGVGGAGPHVYLGMLRKALALQPDLFVAMLYVGNDFMDALYVQDHFSGRKGTRPPYDEYQKPLDDAQKKWKETSLIGNSFNQCYRYKLIPDEEPLALAEVIATFDSMAKICADNHIQFVVGIIPTKPEVDEDDKERSAQIMADLNLTDTDMQANVRLHEGFAHTMRGHGFTVVDPTEAMKAGTAVYYWLRDHHLNVEGNRMVAEQLFPVVQARLENLAMPARQEEK